MSRVITQSETRLKPSARDHIEVSACVCCLTGIVKILNEKKDSEKNRSATDKAMLSR